MENRAFVSDGSDGEDSPLATASTASLPGRIGTAFPVAMTSAEANEQLPINIHRPIFYSSTFYPALRVNSRPSRATTTICINHDSSGTSSPDSQCPQSPTLFTKFSATISRLTSSQRPTEHSLLSLCAVLLPILRWLPKYKVRSDLLADLIAGITVLALHIPQGLAYGKLAGAESINGLYVSLFPVVIYAFYGGSRQISVGTFAVICIACKDVIDTLELQGLVIGGHHYNASNALVNGLQAATNIEVLTSLCLLVGLIQFFLGFFRLGILATLLSDPIISAFVVACALYVFTSQVFALFGISSARIQENEPDIPFELIKDWLRLFRRLPRANIPTVLISIGTIFTLVSCKMIFEPFLQRKFRLQNIVIPIDIMVIAVLTTVSYAFDLNARYKVPIIPKLTSGFEGMPVVPRIDLWPKFFTSAILIAFIAYAATYTLGKIYAQKHQYKLNPNQELIALGVANVASSFLLCFPASGSLARSAVQEKVGGRTQLASLVSSALIVVFLLFLSHLLDYLPNCVLACIIVVALRSTMYQFVEFFYYWKISKIDGMLWMGTFLLVILCGVANGLIYGLAIGIAFLVIRIAVPEFNLKHRVPGSECYLPSANGASQSSGPSDGVAVFDFHGAFIFLNVERFKKCFKEIILRPILLKQNSANGGYGSIDALPKTSATAPVHAVVFDMSRVPYIDGKAVECLLEVDAELATLGVTLLLAEPSEQILQCFKRCDFFSKVDDKRCYLTVHDAVCAANGLQFNFN